MSVKSIISNIDSNNNNIKKFNVKNSKNNIAASNNVSFQGINPVVGLMDFIEAGGYAASFLIQDGLGFIAPRVGAGLYRGGPKKKDENGNDILDKNGEPKRGLNWAYARKEGIREVVTGPSAFIIPYFMLKYISKKFGAGNNVKLNYINGFNVPFTKFANENIGRIKAGTAVQKKSDFYTEVFKDVLNKSVNDSLPEAEKMTAAEIEKMAKKYSQQQIKIENILSDKTLSKKAKSTAIANLGGSVEDSFMKLKKSRIGGTVNELSVRITSADGSVKGGSIGELLKAMNDYFGDAVNNAEKVLKNNLSREQLEQSIKKFTNRKMGSRILTNLGIFGVVAAAYTQIPKLYNMGTGGKNPALANDEDMPALQKGNISADSINAEKAENQKDISFGTLAGTLEKAGEKVFNNKNAKKVSDIFELNGPIISGAAMPVLLYGFCIPPRLQHAQDKYDYGEIIVRDMTAFTTLLFGAKALARAFSDGFTNLMGLALNKKDFEGRNIFQKIGAYLNPEDGRHHVLSSKQLASKYTNLQDYKGGINGFVEFIEQSGGNIKKVFTWDGNIKNAVDKIVNALKGKSFEQASAEEIREALQIANGTNEHNKLMDELYNLFKKDNGLLRKAKTCNSAFGFFSTILFVPGLIIGLTHLCKKMTDKRKTQEKQELLGMDYPKFSKKMEVRQLSASSIPSNTPTMAGFLNK